MHPLLQTATLLLLVAMVYLCKQPSLVQHFTTGGCQVKKVSGNFLADNC